MEEITLPIPRLIKELEQSSLRMVLVEGTGTEQPEQPPTTRQTISKKAQINSEERQAFNKWHLPS